jgi:T-complex protein 1 subunit alpha
MHAVFSSNTRDNGDAWQILVELAELQDQEVGDGTTSVVIIAAELLKRANALVRNKIHPTSVIAGYRLAMREACKYVEDSMAVSIESLGKDCLLNCAKTSMSSKIVGVDPDFYAKMVVESVLAVRTITDMGDYRYPIKSVNILKAHGKSARESRLIHGYAINVPRAAQGMPKMVKDAKVALLDINLQKTKMQMGVQVGAAPRFPHISASLTHRRHGGMCEGKRSVTRCAHCALCWCVCGGYRGDLSRMRR